MGEPLLVLGVLLVLGGLAAVPILVVVLWVRLRQLERQVNALAAGAPPPPRPMTEPRSEPAPQTPSPATIPQPPAPPPSPAPLPSSLPAGVPQAPAAAAGDLDLETLIAGRWLNRVGIVALLVATAFFLKYAFDNDWIGPAGRVAIGLLLGAALLVWSRRLLARGYRYFSEGMAGLGAAVLYLSLYAAWGFYHLLPQAAAFAGMAAVTAGMVALAAARRSQRIALVALAGGYATPLLLAGGNDQQAVLFGYLLILNGGMLGLARMRAWRVLEWLALFATLGLFWSWYERFYTPEKLLPTALWASAFFLQFAALPVLRTRTAARVSGLQVAFVLVNLFSYLVALHAMLWPGHRWALTVVVLVGAALHLAVARAAPRAPAGGGERAPGVRLVFAGLALTLATLAIPIRLEGPWITMALAVEGAVLAAAGLVHRLRPLRLAGLVLFAIVALRLVVCDPAAGRFLLNARAATFGVAVVCFAVAMLLARRHREALEPVEARLFSVVGIAANVFLFWVLSAEVWDELGRRALQAPGQGHLAQQLGLSLLWVAYAAALTASGFARALGALRWQGLVLFGVIVGKVFLYDLSFLDRFYRIVSFVVVGAVLLAVSFVYQRRAVPRRAAGEPAGDPGDGG